jgi:hypothetical protein
MHHRTDCSGSDIPREVLDMIGSHVQQSSLPALLASSRLLHDIGLAHLYSYLTDLTIPRFVRCLVSLVHHRTARHVVHTLHLDFTPLTLPSRNLLSLVHRVLIRLTKLQDLSFEWRERRNSLTSPTWIMENTSFALRSLATSFRPDGALACLLRQQPALEELELYGRKSSFRPVHSFDFPLPVDAVPRLRKLRALQLADSALAQIVAGRPLEDLSVCLHVTSGATQLQKLMAGTAPLRRLSIINMSRMDFAAILAELSKTASALQGLHVVDVRFIPGNEVCTTSAYFSNRHRRSLYSRTAS